MIIDYIYKCKGYTINIELLQQIDNYVYHYPELVDGIKNKNYYMYLLNLRLIGKNVDYSTLMHYCDSFYTTPMGKYILSKTDNISYMLDKLSEYLDIVGVLNYGRCL